MLRWIAYDGRLRSLGSLGANLGGNKPILQKQNNKQLNSIKQKNMFIKQERVPTCSVDYLTKKLLQNIFLISFAPQRLAE